MLISILMNIVGVGVFLFIFWRNLKEDYPPEKIFTAAFYQVISISLLLILAKYSLPKYWFWLGFIGEIAGLLLSKWIMKLKFYEIIEAATLPLLIWFSFSHLVDAFKNNSWFSLSFFIFIILEIVFYLYLNSHYKRFSWYKSGRIGFSALLTLASFFLIRGVIAVFFPFMLSFVGSLDILFSGVATFLSFLMLLNCQMK